MVRSIGKQSGNPLSMPSPEEEKKGYGGKDCRKGIFQSWNERVEG